MLRSSRLVRVVLAVWLIGGIASLGHCAVRLDLLPISQAPALWLELAYGHWALLNFVIATLALGSLVFRLPFLADLKLCRAEALVLYLGGGLWATTLILFPPTLFGSLRPIGIPLYLLLALSALGLELRCLLSLARSPRTPQSTRRGQLKRLSAIAFVLLLSAPYWLQTMVPYSDFDSVLHHLPMASGYLESGLWPTDPSFTASAYPGGIHLIYALLMGIGAESAILPFNLLMSLACILAAYALAKFVWGDRVARITALTCAGINLLLELGLDARIDNILTFAVVVAIYAFIRWDLKPREPGMLILCGAMLGLCLGVKYTGGILIATLMLPILVLAVRRRRLSGAQIGPALAVGLVVLLVPHAGWYVRNFLQYEDPAYPLWRGKSYATSDGELRRFEPDVEQLSRRMPVPNDLMQLDAPQDRHIPSLFNPVQVLFQKSLIARKPLHRVSPFLVFFLLLPVIKRDRSARWLAAIGLTYYGIVASQSHLIRYALPILPVWAAGAAAMLALPRARAFRLIVALLLWELVVVNSVEETLKLLRTQPQRYWAGTETPLEWLRHVGYNNDTAVIEMLQLINADVASGSISPDEPLFMVGEGRCHHLKVRCLPDISPGADRWVAELLRADGDLVSVRRSLAEQGIRHILYYPKRYPLTRYEIPSLELNERQRFALYYFLEFARKFGEPVHLSPESSTALIRLKDLRSTDT
jgi:4-amino-4-deoxy-L-arabinose transferase-like glycosyltransferase